MNDRAHKHDGERCPGCRKMQLFEKKLGPLLHRSRLDPRDAAKVMLLYAHVGMAVEYGHENAKHEHMDIVKAMFDQLDTSDLADPRSTYPIPA
jgi:hypothetical protein